MSKSNFYCKVRLQSKSGTMKYYNIHPVLYAIIEGGYALMNDNRHFFGIITGNVGDGKSNLAAQLISMWERKNKRHLSYDNIVWTTEKFIMQTDRSDNKTHAIWWDEAIQGATGKKMAMTSEGEMLKISIVTKRFKKHFYLLIVDEIEEYSWKLIKMANFWIHVHTRYNERGYFKCWTSKRRIKTIYQAFKYYKWDWSRINIKPDVVGRFFDYLPSLLDQEEYDKHKLAATQVIQKKKENDKKSKQFSLEQLEVFNLIKEGKSKTEISDKLGIPRTTIYDWEKKMSSSRKEI